MELSRTDHELSLYTENPFGNLSVVTPPSGPSVANQPGSWVDMPGLSTAVFAHASDTIAIKLSAEVEAPGPLFVRILIDSEAAQPAEVLFKQGGIQYDGVRSFTFVRSNIAAGRHIVAAQWRTEPGVTAFVGKRAMTVNTAAPAWGDGRLVAAAVDSADIVVDCQLA